MLVNMFVGRPPGNYDRLLDFSRAVTGTLFFVPSATFLENVRPGKRCIGGGSVPTSTRLMTHPTANAAPDGSLGIVTERDWT